MSPNASPAARPSRAPHRRDRLRHRPPGRLGRRGRSRSTATSPGSRTPTATGCPTSSRSSAHDDGLAIRQPGRFGLDQLGGGADRRRAAVDRGPDPGGRVRSRPPAATSRPPACAARSGSRTASGDLLLVDVAGERPGRDGVRRRRDPPRRADRPRGQDGLRRIASSRAAGSTSSRSRRRAATCASRASSATARTPSRPSAATRSSRPGTASGSRPRPSPATSRATCRTRPRAGPAAAR